MKIIVDARPIEEIHCHTLGLWHFSDEKPLMGITGVVDWYLDANLSRLVISGKITGQWAEKVLVAGIGDMVAGNILVVGLGKINEFNEGRISLASGYMVSSALGLGLSNICMTLPGDGLEGIDIISHAEHTLYGLAKEIGERDLIPRIICDERNVEEVLLGFQTTKVRLKGQQRIDIERVGV